MTERLEITIDADVRDAIEEHAFGRVDVEVGGFLIGEADADSVRISDSRPALAAESEQTRLTFTHEAWADVLEYLDAQGSGAKIVGWYHTHPNFGCFLSDYDQFIQENFFSGPGQVALVIDPVRGESAFFRTEGDDVVTLREEATRRDAIGQPDEDTVDVIERISTRAAPPKRRKAPLVLGGLVLAVLAGVVGWFVGSVTGQDAARNEARAQVEQLRGEVETLEAERDLALVPEEDVVVEEPTATPTPAPEPTPSPSGVQPGDEVPVTITHTLRSGETLWGLAARYLGSGQRYVEIVEVNPGIDPVGMRVGDQVRIPLVGQLQAVEGDTT